MKKSIEEVEDLQTRARSGATPADLIHYLLTQKMKQAGEILSLMSSAFSLTMRQEHRIMQWLDLRDDAKLNEALHPLQNLP